MQRHAIFGGGLAALVMVGLAVCFLTLVGGSAALADGDGGGGDLVPGVIAAVNGDTNADGVRDVSDAIYLLTHLFLGGPAPLPLSCEPNALFHNGDVDGSGLIGIGDPIYMLDWLFRGGNAPRASCELGV